jgi:Uncharacterized protein conserved in bacteria
MVTVYGPRSTTEATIAGVRRMHDRVAGTTTSGEAYRAPENLMQCTYVCGGRVLWCGEKFCVCFLIQ